MKDFADFESLAAEYYTHKVLEHGATPAGVDWNSTESQELRFNELLRVVRAEERFSVIDYGCGYGALLQSLRARATSFDYTGFDVSREMIERAVALHGEQDGVRWTTERGSLREADYVVASGIFNVKLDAPREEWTRYVIGTLDALRRLSRRGFAFNMLTSYSDRERMRPDLYYGDPCFYFDHAKRHYSKQVALLHDYGLWEFTIVVRCG